MKYELHCDPVAFQRMKEAELLAEIEGRDAALAAFHAAWIGHPPAPYCEVEVIVDQVYDPIFPMGHPKLVLKG